MAMLLKSLKSLKSLKGPHVAQVPSQFPLSFPALHSIVFRRKACTLPTAFSAHIVGFDAGRG